MELSSSVFKNGDPIPKRYSKEGENLSPPLFWSDVPRSCREFVLLCEDPDAPKRLGKDYPFIHWVAYHISPETTALPEGMAPFEKMDVPVRAFQGLNSSSELGYMGPMPPVGHGTHRYLYKLFALDSELVVPPGSTWAQVEAAMQDHILDATQFYGTYVRNEA